MEKQMLLNAFKAAMPLHTFSGSQDSRPSSISDALKPRICSGLKTLPAELGQQTASGMSFIGV
jgi:hypothetical protein